MRARVFSCLAVLGLLAVLSASSAPGQTDRGQQGKKYAILVGVKEYEHSSLPDLKHTENDVEELAKVLDLAGFNTVVLTTSRGKKDEALKPTAKNIRAQLKKLTDKVTKRDLLLIGLAGHGLQLSVPDPSTKRDKEESFFCPTDAKPKRGTALAELKKTMIPLGEMFKELEESGAGTKLMLIDACRNDPKLDSGARNMDVDNVPKPGSGVAALFSCKGGERAFESDKVGKGHGIFFHFVIEAFKGRAKNDRGEVTWSRLAEYVIDKVSDEVPTLIGDGAKQTPQELKNLTGKSPVLIGGGEKVDSAVVQEWFRTGEKYDFAQGVERDFKEAFKWYKKAADKGHASALNNVGSMYQRGEGVEKDNAQARKYYLLAADKGSAVAMNNLGFLYDRGIGVEKDMKEAVKWYRKSAEGGNEAGMYNYALCLAYGDGVARDNTEAARWYRQAAEKGHVKSMFYLANQYREGNGVKLDDAEALKWYTEAAKKSDPGSMTWVGVYHETGRGGLKVDHKEAIAWYTKAAAANEPYAMTNLGVMYEFGTGVEKDEAEALKWYKKAADLEHGRGLYRLGLMYANGKGVAKDDKEAVKLYRRSVAKNEVDAINELGMMYDYGRGVEMDTAEAVKLFRRAAGLNHTIALYNMGVMYESGRGVTKDLKEALKWYRKAAEKGDEPAKKKVEALEKENSF